MLHIYYSVYFFQFEYSEIMIEVLLIIILYTLFGLIGIFLFKNIIFTKEIFSKQQNGIISSICFLIFVYFLAKHDGNNNILSPIVFGVVNYLACFAGATIAAFLGMKFKFYLNSKLFYYSLHGSIIFGSVLLFAVSFI